MSEVRRRTTSRQQGFDPASGLSGADGLESFARRSRQGDGGASGERQSVAIVVVRTITPGESGEGTGVPVEAPSGTWLLSLTAGGNWDDILVGFDYHLDGPGGGDLTLSQWVAHRPSGALESSAGSVTVFPVKGGTVTPGVIVSGSGEGDVTVIVRFDPCEGPAISEA